MTAGMSARRRLAIGVAAGFDMLCPRLTARLTAWLTARAVDRALAYQRQRAQSARPERFPS